MNGMNEGRLFLRERKKKHRESADISRNTKQLILLFVKVSHPKLMAFFLKKYDSIIGQEQIKM